MFLTLPKSAALCSFSTTPPNADDTKSKSKSKTHRPSSLLTLLKTKKKNRGWAKPYTHKVDTTTPLLPTDQLPPTYSSIYETEASGMRVSTSEQPRSPSLNSPTRSRSRKHQTHLRRPSQPWTTAPNAPKRVPTFTSEEEEAFCAYNSFYPTPQANQNSHMPKVVVSGKPPSDGPVCVYSTFYPSNQSDDLSLFSPFGSAPSGGFHGRAEAKIEAERKGRRISTGCAWEKIGERRAREGARGW